MLKHKPNRAVVQSIGPHTGSLPNATTTTTTITIIITTITTTTTTV